MSVDILIPVLEQSYWDLLHIDVVVQAELLQFFTLCLFVFFTTTGFRIINKFGTHF